MAAPFNCCKTAGAVVVVLAVDVEVVHIQQQMAVGFGHHGIDKFHLAHLLGGQGVVGGVFDGDALAEYVLGLADAGGGVLDGLLGKRQGNNS